MLKLKKIDLLMGKELLSPVETNLLCALISAESGDGWVFSKELLTKKNPYTDRLFFTTDRTSLPRYIRQLESKNLIERKQIETVDRYNRKSTPFMYRIKPKSRYVIENLLVDYEWYSVGKDIGYSPFRHFTIEANKRFGVKKPTESEIKREKTNFDAAISHVVSKAIALNIPLSKLHTSIENSYNNQKRRLK